MLGIISLLCITYYVSGAFINEDLLAGNQYAAGLKTSIWPKVIPYRIDPNLSERYVKAVEAAIKEIETKTCLRFKKQTDETGYMHFEAGKKCHSSVAYISSHARPIKLAAGCYTKGLILHLIMHSLGFMVESNRPDRDQFVKVVWDNIPLGNYKYFERRDPYSSMAQYFNMPYDVSSIMHPSRFYKGNYSVTLVTLDYYQRYKIGQRKGLSELDALSINLLYRCPGATKPPSTIPPNPTDPPQPELKPILQKKIICGHLTDNIQCPFGYHIWVENAMYGRQDEKTCTYGRGLQNKCSAPIAEDLVREKCHGKMECRLHAYNRDFGGDPCVGTYKYLAVKYRCSKTDTMCFKGGKQISCPKGQVLKILDATYGRTSKYICPTTHAKTFNCCSAKSLEATKARCDGKESCKFLSSIAIYGDPCPGTLKYLQVTHQCVLKESS